MENARLPASRRRQRVARHHDRELTTSSERPGAVACGAGASDASVAPAVSSGETIGAIPTL